MTNTPSTRIMTADPAPGDTSTLDEMFANAPELEGDLAGDDTVYVFKDGRLRKSTPQAIADLGGGGQLVVPITTSATETIIDVESYPDNVDLIFEITTGGTAGVEPIWLELIDGPNSNRQIGRQILFFVVSGGDPDIATVFGPNGVSLSIHGALGEIISTVDGVDVTHEEEIFAWHPTGWHFVPVNDGDYDGTGTRQRNAVTTTPTIKIPSVNKSDGSVAWGTDTPSKWPEPGRFLATGGAAGNITATGILASPFSKLFAVLELTAGAITADLTAEFTIADADTINNTGGADTTGKQLLVLWTTFDSPPA